MKYYVLNNDWQYDCLKEEVIPSVYNEISLNFGELHENLPIITLVSKTEKLPNHIPNHKEYLFFDKKIISIIESFNIDYIQFFEVLIKNRKGDILSDEYKNLNIIKVIDAIDYTNSKLVINDGDIVDVEDLRLDYSKIEDELIFRLENCEILVFFREDIAKAIVNAKCTGIEFFEADGYRI